MPKVKKNAPIHKTTPYTRVTTRSLGRFSHFHPEDQTNATNTTRDIGDYSESLGLKRSLKNLIIHCARKQGRKITILDSGCGAGVAINELLADESLTPYIQQVTGVSLHYFAAIKQVMELHKNRFNYYLGTVQNVLSKALETHKAFDLIFDVWGSYPYSLDKLSLLKQYHQALQPGGQALILTTDCWHPDLYMTSEHGESLPFATWAVHNHPNTFHYRKNRYDSSVIQINKNVLRWGLEQHQVQSSEEASSLNLPLQKRTKRQLQQINALMFSEVTVESAPEQPRKLRPLACL
jgi:SAM-dependent methyltransferase